MLSCLRLASYLKALAARGALPDTRRPSTPRSSNPNALCTSSFGYIQIGMEPFGDLGSGEQDRSDSTQATLDLRYQQIEAAETAGSQSTVNSQRRAAESLETALTNWTLAKQFARWRSDKTMASGWSMQRAVLIAIMFVACVVLSAIQFAQPNAFAVLAEFPTDGN